MKLMARAVHFFPRFVSQQEADDSVTMPNILFADKLRTGRPGPPQQRTRAE
jgi:hypothetical protein